MSPATDPDPMAKKGPARADVPWLLVILGLATVLRFTGLGEQSLWGDEAYTWHSLHLDWKTLLWTPFDVHPPLFYAILKPLAALGPSELWLRLPSAIFGVLGCGAVWWVGRTWGGRWCGLVAASVLAVHPTHIMYSQEARNYTLLWLLLTVALAGLLRVHATPRRAAAWLLYAAGATLALYTHVIAAIYVCALNLALLLVWWREGRLSDGIGHSVAVNLATLLAWAPWILRVPANPPEFGWVSHAGPIEAFTRLQNMVGVQFVSELQPDLNLGLFLLAAAGATMAIRVRRSPLGALALGLLVLGPVLLQVVSTVRPMNIDRAFLPALLGAAFSLGLGIAWLRQVWPALGRFSLVACLLVAEIGTLRYHRDYQKQPWRQIVEQVDASAGSADAILLCPWFSYRALGFYEEQRGLKLPVFTELPEDHWGGWFALDEKQLVRQDIRSHQASYGLAMDVGEDILESLYASQLNGFGQLREFPRIWVLTSHDCLEQPRLLDLVERAGFTGAGETMHKGGLTLQSFRRSGG